MKRAISIPMTLIISLSVFGSSLFTVNATPASAINIECGDYSYKVLADGTASIESYNGTATSVDVPSELDGYKVTSLGAFAFCRTENLESVTIPESVTIIVDSAFHKCDNLYEIKIDSNNPIYDSRENCNAIIESETNTLIAGCNGTIIPSGVTSVGSCAFSGCTNLSSITIPEGVTSVGGAVFINCTNLSSVTISKSVTNIGDDPFYGCVNLAEIKVDSNNPVYDSRENCNALIESKTNTLIAGCKNTVIPDNITTIAEEAFYNCEGLTAITIPQSVTSIADSAFSSCTNLTSITIPDGVTSIGTCVFHYCLSLSEIKIDGNNKVYDSRENCNAIIESDTNTLIAGCKDTTIPDTVTSIGKGAFSGCTNLESIIIPKSLTSIGEDAFYNCRNLKSITIPDNVTNIGEDAFDTNSENMCLYVSKNSNAHKYAKSADLNYELIDSVDNDNTSETINSVDNDDKKSKLLIWGTGYILLSIAILIVIAVTVLCIVIFKKQRDVASNSSR